MTRILAPRGWRAGDVLHRHDDVGLSSPLSFDLESGTVDCTLSMGSPVKRFYGTEKLRISPDAVDCSRIRSSLCPLLDSHQNDSITRVLGRVSRSWFDGASLMGTLTFAETPQGQVARGMVERGEIVGISLGYLVDEWEISDEDGSIIDENNSRNTRWDDMTYTATSWTIHEASLVSVPADSTALIRSLSRHASNHDVRTRMEVRARMSALQAAHERGSVH